MSLYPIFLNISGAPVLVVGGGRVAARKARDLLASGAVVTAVAPEFCDEMVKMAAGTGVELQRRPYSCGDLEGKVMVIAATGSEDVNRRVFEDARRPGVLCNVADHPGLCDFHVPARMRRGLLQIAVSTGGASPAMARRIREELENKYTDGYGILMEAMLEMREFLKCEGPESRKERRRLLEDFLDSGAPEVLIEGEDGEAFRAEVENWKGRVKSIVSVSCGRSEIEENHG